MTPDELAIIIRLLESNDHSIKTLNLGQKELTPAQSEQIFIALKKNKVVTELKFLGNDSSGQAAVALGAMLEENTTIELLELGTNQLSNADLPHIIKGLKANTSVINLDLNSNLFTNPQPIADILKHNNTIQEIELTNSEIEEAGFEIIHDALASNEYSSLTTFNVFFPYLPSLPAFQQLCENNADRLRHENGMQPF